MPFAEKPPILTGNTKDDLAKLRDYLFRMAQSISEAAGAEISTPTAVTISTRADGQQVIKTGPAAATDVEAIRKNAQELRSLIVKSAENLQKRIQDGDDELADMIADGDNAVIDVMDRKEEEYNGKYLAKSEFGTFEQDLDARIQTTAAGVVESFKFEETIDSVQEDIDLLQHYYTNIDGEIKRGIVLDPETGDYVTGIAISQNLRFEGECGPTDENNPGDGYTYYYMNEGQTFGLYTSTGWQFWIDGYKKGWFNSTDGMLHVANIMVEVSMQVGPDWQMRAIPGRQELEILFVGNVGNEE